MSWSRREFVRSGLAAAASLPLCGVGCSAGSCGSRSGAQAGAAAGQGGAPADPDEPGYLALERSGELKRREAALWEMLAACRLCPRECGVNRLEGEVGVCRSTAELVIKSAGPHFGEESALVGMGGSGTVFFSQCNLRCVFCQNWEINHRGDGTARSHEELAQMMLGLQERGCNNINLVTPTHVAPHIVRALRLAIKGGLELPLVYNTSAYDNIEVIKLLDGVVDIYLPDFKYQDGAMAARYSNEAEDYPEVAARGIKEMHRQVGNLQTAGLMGVAKRGLILRHLVMPHNIGGTDRFVRWVARELEVDTYVNLMAQYRPAHRADEFPEIARRLTEEEWEQAVGWAKAAGLERLDT